MTFENKTLNELQQLESELLSKCNSRFTDLKECIDWQFSQRDIKIARGTWDQYFFLQKEYISAIKELNDCYQAQHDLNERLYEQQIQENKSLKKRKKRKICIECHAPCIRGVTRHKMSCDQR